MRRSILRLVALSLTVAALAMVATTLFGARHDRTNALLTTDTDIRDALYTYANEHDSWAGVAGLVRNLATRTGRRIALTTPTREPIVDSAELNDSTVLGDGLPSTPAARIDAAAPKPDDVRAVPTVVARSRNVRLEFYQWQLTDRERRERQALAEAALDCPGRGGTRTLITHYRSAGPPPVKIPCVPDSLLEPSAATRALAEDCADSPEWTPCMDRAKRPYVAGPADLYLGERVNPMTWLTAAAVLLAAAVITVPAARRILSPFVVAARRRTTLLGDVTHELRTPLTNIRGHLDAVQDGVLPLDRTLVHSLAEESTLLERLVADLADLTLADAGPLRIHPEAEDAATIAEHAVTAHRPHAEASEVDLRLIAPGPVPVHADPTRLRQALGNLITNAIRHTPGGTVTVTVTRTPTDVVLAVSDTGAGIAPDHLPHILDRHYSQAASTGLGLTITRHLVDAHGGRLEIASTPGTGTTAAIRLPHRDQL
jgi:two-component system sensor histidine kinase BaeS